MIVPFTKNHHRRHQHHAKRTDGGFFIILIDLVKFFFDFIIMAHKKAFTTRIPARHSRITVFTLSSFSCTSLNFGIATRRIR